MNITQRDIQALSKRFSLSDKAVQRLLGSVIVELAAPLSPEDIDEALAAGTADESLGLRGERFDLGLRLGKDNSMDLGKLTKGLEDVAKALTEYRSVCPLIFAWVQAGDFDPKRIPERVTRGVLLHASRTAGRLRAKLMRA